MRVEVDRQADFLLQRADQLARGRRLQQPRHVLDAENVRAGGLELFREIDVVLEVVLGAHRVEDVAGVADRRLGNLARLADRVDRDAHVLHPVQAVEDAEHVHAGLGRLLHEEAHDVVRVVGVTDAVGRAQQHLLHQVGHGRRQVGEPLPRVLVQEAHRDVEGRPAPGLDREQLRQPARVVRRDAQHVVRPHARRHQRLVCIPEGGVGDQRHLAGLHECRDRLGAVAVEYLAHAVGRRLQVDGRLRGFL